MAFTLSESDLLEQSSADAISPPLIKHLGLVPYGPTLEAMRDFAERRDQRSPDQIWLLEHEPVFTLGQAGKAEHLLDPDTGIAVVRVERGGQITYHGPGQLVAYTLIDLRRAGIKVREFVRLLEGAVIDTLASYNVAAFRKPGAPGIYVDLEGALAKIAALGLKVKNGSTFHGLALNVAMDLAPFRAINPCGYEGLLTIDMASLGVNARIAEVAERLSGRLLARIKEKDWS